ncbi:transporter [Sediminitomix flava]|uniref:Outer membrane putative beta-barrel porin/alpha-amylase n=1 Tax=Sediminitomix flava TaxID=379075 RepID=A0A315Z856_SEDFL|nr:transporter [Sediminitomix flava]PWJ39216.1 outer membrane putative beta-barrel porin/alpha-amylase [Sediminitomix flava]
MKLDSEVNINLRSIAAFTYLFILPNILFAQHIHDFESDRPGIAISSSTVGKNVLFIQTGAEISGYENGSNDGHAFLVNSNFRLGVTETFEVDLDISIRSENNTINGEEFTPSGIDNLSLGVRNTLLVGKGAIPSIAFQFLMSIPAVLDDFKSKDIAPKVIIATQQSFGKRWSFSTNFGSIWDGNTPHPLGTYVLNLGFGFSKSWTCFIEHYAFFQKDDWDGKVDLGLAFLLTPHLQLDTFGGYSKNGENISDWFVSAGFTWKFDFKNKN